MNLCIDVGNSQIFGGVLDGSKNMLSFRLNTQSKTTSDELGISLSTILQNNKISPEDIQKIVICSVVPSADHALKEACKNYLHKEPLFLKNDLKTNLTIKYKNPREVGADLIANSIAAVHKYPQKNIIIASFGTATVLSAITAKGEFLGGSILPGFRVSMEALAHNTAKLPHIDITKPNYILGSTTQECIQSGLFISQLGAVNEFVKGINEAYFKEEPPIVLATGGFSYLFENQKPFDAVIPDLILQGLQVFLQMNI